MIQPIVKDVIKLSLPSVDATIKDAHIIDDLKDTIKFYQERCIGMSASMLGFNKNIMIIKNFQRKNNLMFSDEAKQYIVLVNPKIIKAKGKYTTVEECLSVAGSHEVERYRNVEVEYLDEHFESQRIVLSDMTARVFLHEFDHFLGKLV